MNENNINRLTAERVMGWTLDYMHDDLRPKFPMEVWRDSKWNWLMESYLWNPADDLNKAWKVAKAASAKTGLLLNIIEMENGKWFAHFAGSEFDAAHMNPATAICLAALRAVGVPEEEVNRE